jgi:DNA-binding Lrp family transcriptional regulator
MLAYVLICCEAGRFSDVVKTLKGFREVKRAFSVLGRWDAVAEVEAADVKALGEIALKINALSGVRATETLISF